MAADTKVSPGIQAEIARSKCFGLACDPADSACKRCSLMARCKRLTEKVIEDEKRAAEQTAANNPVILQDGTPVPPPDDGKLGVVPTKEEVLERKDTPTKPNMATTRKDGTHMNTQVNIVNGQNPDDQNVIETTPPVKVAEAAEIGVGAAAESAAEAKDNDATARTVAAAAAAENPVSNVKASGGSGKADKPKKPKKPATQYRDDMPDFKSMTDDQLKEHLRGAGVDVGELEAKHGGDARILRMQMVMAAKKPYKIG